MARQERWESSEVSRWEVTSFIQRWGTQGWDQYFIFLFLMLINEMKKQELFKKVLRELRNGKILLRSNGSRLS